MEDTYRLIFRGEVLEGQHPSVVKKRLAASLKWDDAKMDKLFMGQPVVLKREADTKTAAKLQALFKKAGARLRVMSVETDDGALEPEAVASDNSPAPSQPTEDTSDLDVLPPGAEVLTSAERRAHVAAEVNTDHLSVDDAGSDLGTGSAQNPDDAPVAPEVSHLSMADVGADLQDADERAQSTEKPAPDVDFEIADVGSDVLPPADRQPELEVDIDLAGYDLADVGADIGETVEKTPPPAPDISHLELDRD